MRRRRLHVQYRHRIAAVTFLIVAVPLATLGLMYFGKLYQERRESAVAEIRDNLADGVDRFRARTESYTSKLFYLTTNMEISTFLQYGGTHDLDAVYDFMISLRPVFEALTAGERNLFLSLYSYREDIYGSGDFLRQAGLLKSQMTPADGDLPDRIDALGSGEVLWCRRLLPLATGSKDALVPHLCGYKKMTSLGQTLAILEIRSRFDAIAQLFDFPLPDGAAVVLFLDGSPDPLVLQSRMPEDGALAAARSHAATGRFQNTETFSLSAGSGDTRVVLYLPAAYTQTRVSSFLLTGVGFFVLLFVSIFLIAELASAFLTRRLSLLLNRTNLDLDLQLRERPSVDAGSGTPAAEPLDMDDPGDEFSLLSVRFQELVARIREYYARIAGYEKQQRELELDLLQARINPHFLYNTLDTIKWVSREPGIDRVIDSLVRYYRIALNKGSNILPLSQELSMVEEYLKLEQFTFDLPFQYAFDVEPAVGRCLVIKHILQPVVENAVLHGVSALGADGRIVIRGRLDESGVRLTVEDNGVGIEPGKIPRILSGESLSTLGGYGLANVIRRIGMQYGPPYGLDMERLPEGGTRVTLRLPAVSPESPVDGTPN